MNVLMFPCEDDCLLRGAPQNGAGILSHVSRAGSRSDAAVDKMEPAKVKQVYLHE